MSNDERPSDRESTRADSGDNATRQDTVQLPYDVFISYNSADRSTAERLAAELRQHGFAVWLDRWEILVGHNIVDEVYRGIRSSEFVIVLLSCNSVDSRWVTEELARGRLREIEEQQIRVLPVRLEPCEIPEPLKTKRYADFSSDWQSGMNDLLTAIRALRLEQSLKRTTQSSLPRPVTMIEKFYSTVLIEADAAGWLGDEPFKDALIGPPDDATVTVARRELTSLIDDCRVDLQNYGGQAFPFLPYRRSTVDRLMDGVRAYDTGPSSFADWSFVFWRVTEGLRFASRSSIEEDHLLDERGGKFAKDSLEISWLLKDVCTPLMFAHRILARLRIDSPFLVRVIWNGIEKRRLVSLSSRRAPLMHEYMCSENEFRKDMWIDLEADLHAIALDAAEEIFWLFGWERFPKDTIARDVRSILDGRFPD
jgi:hypothetical protein